MTYIFSCAVEVKLDSIYTPFLVLLQVTAIEVAHS